MTAYLDNAATTKVCKEAAEAALNVMTELYGNPSSTHKMGREAKALLERVLAVVRCLNKTCSCPLLAKAVIGGVRHVHRHEDLAVHDFGNEGCGKACGQCSGCQRRGQWCRSHRDRC